MSKNSITLYGLKSCDTCRKARKALPEAEYVDVREDGVPELVLRGALEMFGEALVNRRSTTWRSLSEEEREGDKLELLKEHPTLMKRPLIATGGELLMGWSAEVQGRLLG